MSNQPFPASSGPLPVANYSYDPRAMADEQHLRLLAIFHYVWAALIALLSCIFIIHIAIGVAMLGGAMSGGPNPPPRGVGYLFVGLGGLAILLGWTVALLNVLSARGMSRRRWRTLSLVVAGFNCLNVPVGTTLGVFTFIVLLRPSVAAMYGIAPPTPYAWPPQVQQ